MEDVVYDDLENFTEEATKAELREENKDLKIKLEEYAAALDNLQKEFDLLSSEHQKLEMNYSSLLKTAKSEIQRKTQMITKMNIEKDAMVLNSIQNRNTLHNKKKVPIDKLNNNKEKPWFEKSNQSQFSSDNSKKPSFTNQAPNERKADNYCPPPDLTSPHIETVLNSVNNAGGNPNINNARNNEIKENIRLKDEEEMPRARINNRRKSMPVFSMDCSKFSTDEDELASSGSSKEYVRKEQAESTYRDRFLVVKPTVVDKILSHQKYSKDSRNRYSRYEVDKYRGRDRHESFEKYRRNHSPDRSRKRSPDKRRGSQERRRRSSDRNRRETRDNSEEFHKRQEYDRRNRSSPSKDKYYHDYKHRSRDSQRSIERNHLQDFDRYRPRSQDMYNMKHKMSHDYEEPSGKRMRLDSHPKDEDERWRSERQVPLDLEHLHNMSCQSPDQTHMEGFTHHQATEIKLNASTKLDDPRLLSKKYALKNRDGKAELYTVESGNIVVKAIDTSNWEISKKVKMPDALLKKPITSDMPSVALLQKPMTTGMPSAALHRPMSSEMSDVPPQKPKYSDKPHTSSVIQKPDVFILNAVFTDIPDTLPHTPMTTNVADSITQKPMSSDDIVQNSPIQKPKSPNMQDILTQKPSFYDETMQDNTQKTSTDDLVKEIYKDIEDISSKCSDSEIYGFHEDFYNYEEDKNEKNIYETDRQDEVKALKTNNDYQRVSNYKIPKKSQQASADTQNAKIAKGTLSSDNDNQKLTTKLSVNSFSTFHRNKITDETSKNYREVRSQNSSKIPQRSSSDYQYEFQNYKDTIEGDLELSDETSDNTDAPIQKTEIGTNDKPVSDVKCLSLDFNKKHKLTSPDQKKNYFDEASSKKVKQNLERKSTETDKVMDTTKLKARKKSLKLKDPQVNKDAMNKPVKEKDETSKELSMNKDTSLSPDQLIKIKENRIKEPLGDKNIEASMDKPVKKKENKSKVLSKNKDAPLSVEKAVKKKEKQPKDSSENKDTVPCIDKPLKKKEDKPKELPEKKGTAAMDKSDKRKEIRTKELLEHKNALPIDKQAKKKQNKLKESSETKECEATSIDKQVMKKDNEHKIKETKFSELFGDSSSLVSPEDLGLIPAVVAPLESYGAIFEDAQDAIDMDTIRSAAFSASIEKTTDIVGKADTGSKTPIITDEPYQHKHEHKEPNRPTESIINQTMYQNLQPELSPKDINVIKTVIISTGTQPQCTLEHDKPDAELHVMQCVKPTVLQQLAVQALATSTPHKIWQQNIVQAEIDPRFSHSRCSNESREASINENPAISISDTTTNAPHTNNTDEPDMTIFVKRRRKVVRKK